MVQFIYRTKNRQQKPEKGNFKQLKKEIFKLSFLSILSENHNFIPILQWNM